MRLTYLAFVLALGLLVAACGGAAGAGGGGGGGGGAGDANDDDANDVAEVTVTLTYDAGDATAGTPPNGGSFSPSDTTVIEANTGSLVRNDEGVRSWNDVEDGSGTSYLPGSTLTFSTSDITLFPEWQPLTRTVAHSDFELLARLGARTNGLAVSNDHVVIGSNFVRNSGSSVGGFIVYGFSETDLVEVTRHIGEGDQEVENLAFVEDDTKLVTLTRGDFLRVFDLEDTTPSATETSQIELSSTVGTSGRLAHGGGLLAVASNEMNLELLADAGDGWTTISQKSSALFPDSSRPAGGMTVIQDGSWVLVPVNSSSGGLKNLAVYAVSCDLTVPSCLDPVALDSHAYSGIDTNQFALEIAADAERLVTTVRPASNTDVHIFELNAQGTTWEHSVTLEAPQSATPFFGRSVALSGDLLAVSDYVDNGASQVFLFENQGGTWELLDTLVLTDLLENTAGPEIAAMRFAPDSRTLYVATPNESVDGKIFVGKLHAFLIQP